MYNKNEKHDKNIANDPNDGNEMKQNERCTAGQNAYV